MKILMLAALALAAPAVAQTAPDQAAPEAAPVAPATPQDNGPTTPAGDPTLGGYGPANTTIVVPPGATVVYKQAPSPDQAYPAPAPLAKYPPCKKGQFDNCVERNSPK